VALLLLSVGALLQADPANAADRLRHKVELRKRVNARGEQGFNLPFNKGNRLRSCMHDCIIVDPIFY
jgi:hypothetical protein